MNQNVKIILIATAIFLVSMSVWMLILGRNDLHTTNITVLEEQAKNVYSNLVLPTEQMHGGAEEVEE